VPAVSALSLCTACAPLYRRVLWSNRCDGFNSIGIPTHSLADITQLRQKTRSLLNVQPRTASPRGVTITSVAERLPSHRSSGVTAFVQDNKKTAFDSSNVREFHALIKPTTELSKRGLDRFVEKLHEEAMRNNEPQDGLISFISKPLAILSPFVIAMAGKTSHVCVAHSASVPRNSCFSSQLACLQTD